MDINVDFHTAVFKLHQILTEYITYLNSPGWNKAYTFKTIRQEFIATDDNIKHTLKDVIETLDKEIKENYKYIQIKKEHPDDEIMSEYSTFFNIYLIYRSILSMQNDDHITDINIAKKFFTYVLNYIGQNSVIDILWGHIWKAVTGANPNVITNELLICRNILNLHMIKSIVSFSVLRILFTKSYGIIICFSRIFSYAFTRIYNIFLYTCMENIEINRKIINHDKEEKYLNT
jgi:hypothetical protein